LSDNNSGRIRSSLIYFFARWELRACDMLNWWPGCWLIENSFSVKGNKGPFFRLRRDCEWDHRAQHLSKHLRAQLSSKLTSVTCGSSVKCVENERCANKEDPRHLSSMLEMQIQRSSSSVRNVLRKTKWNNDNTEGNGEVYQVSLGMNTRKEGVVVAVGTAEEKGSNRKNQGKWRHEQEPPKEGIGDTLLGYSWRTALRRERCDSWTRCIEKHHFPGNEIEAVAWQQSANS
jgi:hypothetical protein